MVVKSSGEATKTTRRRWELLSPALALVSGALLYAAFPPISASWLAWVALVPLLGAARRGSIRAAFGCGLLTGLVWLGGILDWVSLFGEPPFNTILWLLAVGVEALFVGLFAVAVRATQTGSPWLIAALWTLAEWLRCSGPWGFPWGVLGETQARHTTLIQIVAVTGVWGMTFLVALVNGVVGNLSPGPSPKRGGGLQPAGTVSRAAGSPSPFRGGGWGERLLPLLLLPAALAYGLLTQRVPAAGTETLRVAVIQGNVERDEGWQTTRRGEALGTYGALTREALKARPALVLWPETVVPGDLRNDPEVKARLAGLARAGGCHLLVGTPHVDDGMRVKNAAGLIGPEGGLMGWYEKVHLVPFGEYIPMRAWMPFLDRFPEVTDQSPGEEYHPVAAGTTKIGAMICFESAFPDISREFVRRGAGLLAVLTSDASFGRTAAAEHHAAKAIFRAIETRRWVLQAATTGISVAVDPGGRVRRRIELGVPGTFWIDLGVGGPTTPFVRFGDWVVFACLVALGIDRVRHFRTRRERPTEIGEDVPSAAPPASA